MNEEEVEGSRLLRALRLLARGLSMLSVGILMAFVIGEGPPAGRLTLEEWFGFLLFPIGVVTGMVISWWREGLGGAITIGSLAAFYGYHILLAGRPPHGWAFLVFASPGFLFLLYWFARQGGQWRQQSSGLT